MALREGGNPARREDWSAPRKIVKMDGSDLCQAGKTISLDMTCFLWEGEYYVIWSQRQFLPKDLGAWLYIARLDLNTNLVFTCRNVSRKSISSVISSTGTPSMSKCTRRIPLLRTPSVPGLA